MSYPTEKLNGKFLLKKIESFLRRETHQLETFFFFFDPLREKIIKEELERKEHKEHQNTNNWGPNLL